MTLLINQLIDLHQPSLYVALGSIVWSPLYWNLVCRTEHKKQPLTRLFGNSRYRAAYIFALTVFSFGLLRDGLFKEALAHQPTLDVLAAPAVKAAAVVAFGVGSVLVLASMRALGIIGTYMGDYFGILKDEKLECFPFNVCSNPMYNGSTLSFLGTALWYGSPAGVIMSVWVFAIYRVALYFEEPFTGQIYDAREKRRAEAALNGQRGASSAVAEARTQAVRRS